MTDDEHHLRAALLGMDFVPHLHAYKKASASTMQPSTYIDADTMDAIPAREVIARITKDVETSLSIDERADHFIGEALHDLLGRMTTS